MWLISFYEKNQFIIQVKIQVKQFIIQVKIKFRNINIILPYYALWYFILSIQWKYVF